jgi:hypothetical protein
LEHDPEKWGPVFGKRSCSNKELERDDDSRKIIPLHREDHTTLLNKLVTAMGRKGVGHIG